MSQLTLTGGGPSGASGNGLLNGLVTYWALDEDSGNRADLHTNGYTLTEVGTVSNAAGLVYAKASLFAMADDMALMRTRANAALINFNKTTPFTVMAWTYPTAFTGGPDTPQYYRNIFSFNFASYNSGGWQIMTTGNGQLYLGLGSTGGIGTDYTWHIPAPYRVLNQWNFIVISRNGTTITARQDATVQTDIDGLDTFASASAGDFYIGTRAGTTNVFDGRLGPMAIWNRALSSADMDALYNAGAGLPYAAFTS